MKCRGVEYSAVRTTKQNASVRYAGSHRGGAIGSHKDAMAIEYGLIAAGVALERW